MKPIYLIFFLIFSIPCFGQPAIDEPMEDEIFTVAEVMPRFPGCEDLPTHSTRQDCSNKKLLEYIYQNIEYPETAKRNAVQGTAVASFVVEKDGRISKLKIVRSVSRECDLEVLRVIRSFPTWIPGTQQGKTIRIQMTLPVRFKLSDEEIAKVSTPAKEPEPTKEIEDIFKFVEEPARFPGCEDMDGTTEEKKSCADKKLMEFISSNLRYPPLAKASNIQGTVVVSFIVEKDGKITAPKIVKSLIGGCRDEALRLVRSLPDFIPAKQHGKPVRMNVELPIRFKL